MENINEFCKKAGCENYIEWNCGFGDCVSCKLQGQSHNICQVADDCPYKESEPFRSLRKEAGNE